VTEETGDLRIERPVRSNSLAPLSFIQVAISMPASLSQLAKQYVEYKERLKKNLLTFS
jgi:hypothetical protein